MKGRQPYLQIFAGLLVLAALIIFLRGSPRLVDFSPSDGTRDVPQDAPIRITFSRPLQINTPQPYLVISPPVAGSIAWQGDTLLFRPDKAWPAGATIQVRLEPGAQAVGFPPFSLRTGANWSFQVHQPALAILFPANSSARLYRLNPEDGELTLLQKSIKGIIDFTVSLREPLIYFSERDGSGGSTIYRFRVESGQGDTPAESRTATDIQMPDPELVLNCPNAACRKLSLDPLGRFLAYERTPAPGLDIPQRPQVWILPLDEGAGSVPFLAAAPEIPAETPSWSSEGILAFYDRTHQKYRFVQPGIGEIASFTNQTGTAGTWQPDGQAFLAAEIRFLNENISPQLSDLKALADSHLYLFHLNDGRVEDLTPGEGIEDTSPVFSPDGEYLVFARKYLDVPKWTPGRQAWIARTSDRQARPLTDEPLYNHFDFSWSPGSDQLAYVRFDQSSLNKPLQILVLNLLTGESVQLAEGGYQPLWIP